MEENRKVLYSGVQPTNNLTIGNYIGTIKSWRALQEDYDCIFAVSNMHAITVRQEPAEFRRKTLSLAALFLACGVEPEKSIVYVQSHVPAHAELCWALNTFTYVGEMERMTQFKDKSAKHADNINMGLMDYPVLMAADILLYQTDVVPVGADQRQHLEIARNIAQRFNNVFTPTFKVPEGLFRKVGAKISDLQEPAKKMSKSAENPNGAVFLTDDRDTVIRKFKRRNRQRRGNKVRAGKQSGRKQPHFHLFRICGKKHRGNGKGVLRQGLRRFQTCRRRACRR